MMRTQVVVLGSGMPNAEADRAGSGVAIVVDNHPYLVDCGHGVVQRVVEAKAAGKISWSTNELTRLFVTHLHGDHTLGLADLIFTPWIHGRAATVVAYGPAGLEAMVSHIMTAYEVNVREHFRSHPVTEHGCEVEVAGVECGMFYEDERVVVSAFAADHSDMEAYSFKFVTPDCCIVVSGDTKPVAGFAQWASGCDILIHEVYSSRRFASRPAQWQVYHGNVHTSARELASLARVICPELLVLYHQLFWAATPEELIEEITDSYDGVVVSACDLDVF